MKNTNFDSGKMKDLLNKGLELTFVRLLKQKKEKNGFFVFSENGKIKKVKAEDINS
jgi:hypothetical protein